MIHDGRHAQDGTFVLMYTMSGSHMMLERTMASSPSGSPAQKQCWSTRLTGMDISSHGLLWAVGCSLLLCYAFAARSPHDGYGGMPNMMGAEQKSRQGMKGPGAAFANGGAERMMNGAFAGMNGGRGSGTPPGMGNGPFAGMNGGRGSGGMPEGDMGGGMPNMGGGIPNMGGGMPNMGGGMPNMGGGMPNMGGGMPNMGSGGGQQFDGKDYYINVTHGDKVYKLDENSFPTGEDDSVWLVKFYAPWCGACKQMRRQWALLAHRSKGRFRVGSIDCTLHRQYCAKFKLEGFPHIKLIARNKIEEYKGDRQVYPMKQFVNEYMRSLRKKKEKKTKCAGGSFSAKSGVKELCNNVFPHKPVNPWFINFYLSWDSHCKRFGKKWRAVAKEFKGLELRAGAIDCVKNDVCEDFEIANKTGKSSFPVLKLIWGDAVVDYPYNPRNSSVSKLVDWAEQSAVFEDSDL